MCILLNYQKVHALRVHPRHANAYNYLNLQHWGCDETLKYGLKIEYTVEYCQWVQHSFIFWVALPLPLIAKNLSGTPAPTPALKKEWHSFSTPFKRVCAPFSTPITKFLESKLPKLKKIVVRLNQSFSTSKVIRVLGIWWKLLSNYLLYSAFTDNIFAGQSVQFFLCNNS